MRAISPSGISRFSHALKKKENKLNLSYFVKKKDRKRMFPKNVLKIKTLFLTQCALCSVILILCDTYKKVRF